MDPRLLLLPLLAASPPSGGAYVLEPQAIGAGRRLMASPYELQAVVIPLGAASANGRYSVTAGTLAPSAGAPATVVLLNDGFEGAAP